MLRVKRKTLKRVLVIAIIAIISLGILGMAVKANAMIMYPDTKFEDGGTYTTLQKLQLYVNYGDTFAPNNLFKSAIRAIGWGLVWILAKFASIGEAVFKAALRFTDVTNLANNGAGTVGEFWQSATAVFVGLLAVSLVITGILLLVNPQRIRKNSILYSIFIMIAVFGGTCALSSMMSKVLTASQDALFSSDDESEVANIMAQEMYSIPNTVNKGVTIKEMVAHANDERPMDIIPRWTSNGKSTGKFVGEGGDTSLDAILSIDINAIQNHNTDLFNDKEWAAALCHHAEASGVNLGEKGDEIASVQELMSFMESECKKAVEQEEDLKNADTASIVKNVMRKVERKYPSLANNEAIEAAVKSCTKCCIAAAKGDTTSGVVWSSAVKEVLNEEVADEIGDKSALVNGVVYTIKDTYDGFNIGWNGTDSSDLLNQFPYRYQVEWLPCIFNLIVVIILFFCLAYKTIKLVLEIITGQIMAAVFSTQIHNSDRTRMIIQGIFNAYMTVIFMLVLYKLWRILDGQVGEYCGNDTLVAAILKVIIAFVIIDGPDILKKALGYDSGLEEGLTPAWKMAFGMRFAGRGMSRTAKAAASMFGPAAGDGKDSQSEGGKARNIMPDAGEGTNPPMIEQGGKPLEGDGNGTKDTAGDGRGGKEAEMEKNTGREDADAVMNEKGRDDRVDKKDGGRPESSNEEARRKMGDAVGGDDDNLDGSGSDARNGMEESVNLSTDENTAKTTDESSEGGLKEASESGELGETSSENKATGTGTEDDKPKGGTGLEKQGEKDLDENAGKTFPEDQGAVPNGSGNAETGGNDRGRMDSDTGEDAKRKTGTANMPNAEKAGKYGLSNTTGLRQGGTRHERMNGGVSQKTDTGTEGSANPHATGQAGGRRTIGKQGTNRWGTEDK